jgi:hypothetical protein
VGMWVKGISILESLAQPRRRSKKALNLVTHLGHPLHCRDSISISRPVLFLELNKSKEIILAFKEFLLD